MRAHLTALLVVCACAMLAGCNGEKSEPGGAVRAEDTPLDYAQVAEQYNENVVYLKRIWARAQALVIVTNEEGRTTKDQGNGYLQVIGPDRLYLELGNDLIGGLYYLGSNEDRYWWIDTSGDTSFAQIGRHELATQELAQQFGVPVHPLDLIEMMGIVPLPLAKGGPPPGRAWKSGEDGKIVVRLPARFGWRELRLDPKTYKPDEVYLYDAAGELAMSAELTRYRTVEVRGTSARPTAPGMITVTIPSANTEVWLTLASHENKPIKDAAFDIDRILKLKKVDEVYDLDDRAAFDG